MCKKAMLRLLCGLVDWIIVMFASQVVLIGLFDIPMGAGFTAEAFFMLAYCVYNILLVRYMHGQTAGKAIGRLVVIDAEFPLEEWKRPGFHMLLLRESCKTMYFFPIVGWLAGLVSVVLLLAKRAPLHDQIGKTAVVFFNSEKR